MADALHSAAIHLLRHLRKTDTATGVSPARLSVLSVLVFGGPMSLSRLAAVEQVRPPTMSNLVKALEAQGLVRRRQGSADRRITQIEATPEGADLLQEGRRLRLATLALLLQGLSPDERTRLRQAASLIERMLGAW